MQNITLLKLNNKLNNCLTKCNIKAFPAIKKFIKQEAYGIFDR